MKRRIVVAFKSPMIIVFIVILLFFTPFAIYSPGESRNRGVVTAIGIDRIDQQYEVSLLTFIPTANQSYQEKTSVISGKGNSVAEAVYNAQIAMGRTIGLAHAKTTIVNEELLSEDVSTTVDYLSRVASLPENTVFVCTNNSAKEVLEQSQNLISDLGLKLEQIIAYNANNLYVTDTSLEAFYKGYYSYVKSSLIGYLTMEKSGEEGGGDGVSSPSGNSGGQGQSSQGGSNSENESGGKSSKRIENQGKAVLLKEGKKVAVLDVDGLSGINLLNPKSVNQIIDIDGVERNDETLSMQYKVKNKKTLVTTKFENGYPIFMAQLVLGVELVEVGGEHEALRINTEFSEITDDISGKIEQKVKQQFADSLGILREHDCDVIGVGREFFSNDRKQFKKFIDKIGGKENADKFIDYVTFKLSVVVQPD